MKNPNGFGSVEKLKGNRRNKWMARKTIGWEGGKQKRVVVGYFETKDEAYKALGTFKYNPNRKITFKEVYDLWSERHFAKIRNSTIRIIKAHYRNHLYLFNDYCMCDLKLMDLQKLFDNLELTSGTTKSIKSVLSMIFDFAVKNDFIEKNPVRFIELKTLDSVVQRKVFTDEEIEILFQNKDMKYVDTILIMIYTGLRVGELLNLKIEDIDLEEMLIYVKESKTETGIRTIPIHFKILPFITKRMQVNKEYLLTSIRDTKLHYATYRLNFFKVIEELNIGRHTIHDCRHTTATLLSNAGANPISIAKIMGHTDYNGMTAKVYTHKNEIELEKAMNTLN